MKESSMLHSTMRVLAFVLVASTPAEEQACAATSGASIIPRKMPMLAGPGAIAAMVSGGESHCVWRHVSSMPRFLSRRHFLPVLAGGLGDTAIRIRMCLIGIAALRSVALSRGPTERFGVIDPLGSRF
jgi:hypothetical protein